MVQILLYTPSSTVKSLPSLVQGGRGTAEDCVQMTAHPPPQVLQNLPEGPSTTDGFSLTSQLWVQSSLAAAVRLGREPLDH